MDRRGFLGLLGGGAAFALIGAPAQSLPTIPSRPYAETEDAASWIAYRDGRYRLFVPRAELGQNICTGLKRIACAELGIGWDDIDVAFADTQSIAPYRATVGSESIQDYALPLAQACASLRDALSEGRSGQIEVSEREISELRAFAAGALPNGGDIVGGREIVSGQPLFVSDVRLPGMAFGRVVRSGASPELTSKPVRWNETAARVTPGFIALIEGSEFDLNNSEGLGIVASTPGALDRIEGALDVEWSVETPSASVDALLDIDKCIEDGGADYDLADDRIDDDANWDVDIRIDIPMAAHAPMEPRAAVADVDRVGGRVWVGSQDPFYVRDMLADRLDFDENELAVIPCRVGGGFGGKAVPTVEVEAAALSRAVGRPVKVQWTRGQELALGYHRPASSHRVRARLDRGKVRDWRHRLASGHVIFSNAVLPAWMQRLTDFIGDDGAARNAEPPYEIAAKSIGYDLERLPIRTGAWRGLGAGPNALAIEMAMEACANAAGVDPVEFRLSHIADPRLERALSTVNAMAGPAPEKGRGVGCGIYKGVSYGAVIADAGLRGDGEPYLKRLYAAHDCGKVIDADQVRAQCEGNLVWSIGMVLTDRLTMDGSGIAQADFIDAPIPLITDTPPMSIELIETGAPPTGAGETLMASAPGAIVNAFASLIGRTPDRLPMTANAA
ncbi:MAG: molybdopterin cofactor-binding domain-containing protein [Pseudomonadota bacterium]